MFAKSSLRIVLGSLILIFSASFAAAQTSQYRESDFDFQSRASYVEARDAVQEWLQDELESGGDGTDMPPQVQEKWVALLQDNSVMRIVAGKGNGDGEEALREQLIDDALAGTNARGWNGTYKGKRTGVNRAEVRGWDPTEKESARQDPTEKGSADWDPTERKGFDPTQSENPDWDPSSAPTAGKAGEEIQTAKMNSAMQMQSRQFQMISNISKAMHDTAMNSIRNMR